MNKLLFKKQEKVFKLFSILRNLEDLEYSDPINDSGDTLCHYCSGFKPGQYKWDTSLEGHKKDCFLIKNKSNTMKMIISECSDMEDGNYFLNLTTGMYLKNII